MVDYDNSDILKRLKYKIHSSDLKKCYNNKKLVKLDSILNQLKRGKNVQNRTLMRWLDKDEFEMIEEAWLEQKKLRCEFDDKPEVIKEYESYLKKGIFFDNRANYYQRKGHLSVAAKFSKDRDVICERALEWLQELIFAHPEYCIWFDREIDFSHGSLIDASILNLPRLVTSRSLDKCSGNMMLQSKCDIKINVVNYAIEKLKRS